MYNHPAVAGVLGDLFSSGLVIGVAYGSTLGLAHRISHMDFTQSKDDETLESQSHPPGLRVHSPAHTQ